MRDGACLFDKVPLSPRNGSDMASLTLYLPKVSTPLYFSSSSLRTGVLTSTARWTERCVEHTEV